MPLRRVPVRGTDPIEFFRAKLDGSLLPERAYGAIVTSPSGSAPVPESPPCCADRAAGRCGWRT